MILKGHFWWKLPSVGLFSDCRTCKLLFRREWLSQIWTLSIFKGWKVHCHVHPLFQSEASHHPWVSSYVDYSALPGAHSPAPAGQKGTSGMTFWSRCKESITVAPPAPQPYFLCQNNHGNEILREVTKSLASSPVQSAFRTAEQKRWHRHPCSHTRAHTERRTIWPRNIMRVINVAVKRVIDRWRGALSGRSIHNQKDIDDGVTATQAEAHWHSLYYDVPVTMSKAFTWHDRAIWMRLWWNCLGFYRKV